jgi:hypothetical protein
MRVEVMTVGTTVATGKSPFHMFFTPGGELWDPPQLSDLFPKRTLGACSWWEGSPSLLMVAPRFNARVPSFSVVVVAAGLVFCERGCDRMLFQKRE